jgi:hypothetical protein
LDFPGIGAVVTSNGYQPILKGPYRRGPDRRSPGRAPIEIHPIDHTFEFRKVVTHLTSDFKQDFPSRNIGIPICLIILESDDLRFFVVERPSNERVGFAVVFCKSADGQGRRVVFWIRNIVIDNNCS